MTPHKKAIKELNEEMNIPSYFRSYEFKVLAIAVLILCSCVLGILFIMPFTKFIDSKGEVIAYFILGCGAAYYIIKLIIWFLSRRA